MTAGRGRAWAQALLGVDVPEPFDVRELCNRLARRRNRPIILEPFHQPHPDAPSGLWVPTPSADVIFYEQATVRAHRDHFILHEIGHVLCDHDAPAEESEQLRTRYAPDVSAELVTRILARTCYDRQKERTAERFARALGPLQYGTSGQRTGALARAEQIFGSK
jgi:hypothetical protein